MKHLHHANWKMVVENNVDGYHALFTHASVYDAIKPAKVSHVPTKVDVLVRDIGDGHSEIDYSDEYRKLDEEFVWYGRIPRAKLADYVDALEGAYGPEQAHDALVVGPPHTLIWPNLFLAEMNVMFVEPQAPDRTIAYTTAVLIPGQDALNERTLRRSEGAMGPAGFLIADDGEIGMRNQAGLAAELPEWLMLARGMDDDIDRRDRNHQPGQERRDSAARASTRTGPRSSAGRPRRRRHDACDDRRNPTGTARRCGRCRTPRSCRFCIWRRGWPTRAAIRSGRRCGPMTTTRSMYRVPMHPDDDPRTTLAYINDNRRRIKSRVAQLNTGNRHSQTPPSVMRRVVSNSEVVEHAGATPSRWSPTLRCSNTVCANASGPAGLSTRFAGRRRARG